MKKVEGFMKENASFFNEPIVNSFFKDRDNYILLKKTVEQNNKKAEKKLNEAFCLFFLKFRLVNYVTTLSQNYSMYFDKQVRKYSNQITVYESNEPYGDNILKNQTDPENKILNHESLLESIGDEKVYKALLKLSEKEKLILELYFLRDLKINEIAKLLNNSPQNISKSKKKALCAIKNKIQK